jgi:hypothetical protein
MSALQDKTWTPKFFSCLVGFACFNLHTSHDFFYEKDMTSGEIEARKTNKKRKDKAILIKTKKTQNKWRMQKY